MAEGPFGGPRPFLSVRGGAEPEVVMTFSTIEPSGEVIDAVERTASFQTDDILVGADEAPSGPKTVVTVRALRKQVPLDQINEMVDGLSSMYDIEETIIKASIEADEAERKFGDIL